MKLKMNKIFYSIPSMLLALLLIYQSTVAGSFVICIEDKPVLAPIHEPHCVVGHVEHEEDSHHEHEDGVNISASFNECIPCADIELDYKTNLNTSNFKNITIFEASYHICSFLKDEIYSSYKIIPQINAVSENNFYFPKTTILLV